ncbi:MAG: leucine-rich repeat domain-containing protein [Methanobrevibacter sp.]|nr:leucine-rich repeat domain-containing protein [Methanobrevibacter sp.]
MGRYTSYYIYQKFEKRGEQDWIPAYPNTWSIDGEGTMPLSAKTENDPACGYVPPVEPIYRWNVVPGYLCYECNPTKAIINTSTSTYYISGTGEITASEVSAYTAAATDIVISQGCTNIGNNAFANFSGLEFVRIPDNVTSVGDSAFVGCSAMTECQIPYGCQSIGASAFTNCISLSYADIPDTVTSIGNRAFSNCLNLAYASITSALTSIPEFCFFNCDGLSYIELPSSIVSIGNSAFYNCSGLYTLTCNATTPPTLGSYALDGVNSNFKIYVPSGSLNTYKGASGWSNYSNKIYPIQ